nr:asparaginase domain-containing protein [Kibdelosporangium sp. MJ126-NF4]CEL21723.1 hypothetical protein [Kibdelosporangium sp. MJ126-NF4]CTQ92504.1 hypothetical protein [Kibdelosporangium sp. MJ126-NF4]
MERTARIAVFAGPTATILNTPDLITSNKARARHGLSLRPSQFDRLRPQRLAAPATVYIEAFSAHPLERDAANLYAPADGWLDTDGTFHNVQPSDDATPVYVVELHPDDGLYPLPYMARQANGSAWEETATAPFASPGAARQTFYPDARRLYEEIERFGLADHGTPVELWSIADFDFFRSPTVDETLYWLGLTVDTTVPLIGHAAQRRHQSLSADGDRNVVDGVKYIASGVALDERGEDRVGACVVVDELVYTARDVTKVDARPGGYADGLVPTAMPHVTITKYGRYVATRHGTPPTSDDEVEILARIKANLAHAPLAGFVCEGMSPFGTVDPARNAALSVAISPACQ